MPTVVANRVLEASALKQSIITFEPFENDALVVRRPGKPEARYRLVRIQVDSSLRLVPDQAGVLQSAWETRVRVRMQKYTKEDRVSLSAYPADVDESDLRGDAAAVAWLASIKGEYAEAYAPGGLVALAPHD